MVKIKRIAVVVLVSALLAPALEPAAWAGDSTMEAVQIAQMGGTEARELEPRYQPVAPPAKSWYNTHYFFVMSRSLAASTLKPAAKAPLFVLTVPLDIALLPFAAIGGFFG